MYRIFLQPPVYSLPPLLRVPCGSRTRLARLEAWSLCRSAKSTLLSAEREGVEPSRLIARPDQRCASVPAKRLPSPIGLPLHCLKAPVGGLEPPLVGLTGRRLTVLPHRIMQVRLAGFEPAISCSRSTRRVFEDTGQAFPHPEIKSAQRESNPHFRHGKAVGCHYIMGACLAAELSKIIRAPGRTRTGVAALRVRSLRR